MTIFHNERQKTFGGGWSQMVTVDGQQYWLILKRGKYTGRKYGNKTFNWYAQIIKDGKIIFQKKRTRN